MANKAQDLLVWDSCRGRDGFDPPSDLPDDMAAEAFDVVFDGGLFAKRRGSETQTLTGDSWNGIATMYRFVPGQSDAAAQLVFSTLNDSPVRILRVAAGTAAANLTLADTVDSVYPVDYATLNGKCYIAYNSDENRLHVFDPDISTTVVRRSGLETPAAATVADSAAAGTYAATPRDYRIQWVTQVGGTLQRASNLGASVSFTPVGNKTAAVVTRPNAPSEGETHWRVWGSADGDAYFLLSTSDIAIATTTYSDSVNPSDYDDGDPAPDEGFFTPWPSVKYLCSTGDRLLGFGAWETAAGDAMQPRNGRVWISPVLDSSDYDDDERIDASLGGYIDVSRDAGSEDRGIVGPLDNQVLVGLSKGLYILVPTGSASIPYRRVVLTTSLGMVSQASSFIGEDEFGRPCIYFLDPAKGPYRYGADGLQWLGYDVQDVWALFSAAEAIQAHGVYDAETRRVIWAFSTTGSITPTQLIVFHVREGQATATEGVRYGWARWTRQSTQWISSVMFSETIGATMSRNLKPYQGGLVLSRYEDTGSTDDSGTAFQAYATSKVYLTDQLNRIKRARMAYLQAEAATGVLIRTRLARNFSEQTRDFSHDLTPRTSSQTRVRVKYETAETVDAYALQMTVGDAAAVSNAWVLDQIQLPIEFDEEDR